MGKFQYMSQDIKETSIIIGIGVGIITFITILGTWGANKDNQTTTEQKLINSRIDCYRIQAVNGRDINTCNNIK